MKPSPQYLLAVALLVGTILLLRFYAHGEVIPLKQDFAAFPLEVAERWRGQELGRDKEILDVLKVDDFMMRLYQTKRREPVWLYVGYYKSQRTGVTYHSPLNCLPGAGWSIQSREVIPLPFRETVRVNRVLIQKGLDKQLILYWYQDRGRIIANEYWAKGFLVWDAMTRNRTDGALVRISVPVEDSSERAFAIGVEFLKDVFPLLNRYLPA